MKTRVCEFKTIIDNGRFIDYVEAGNFHKWGKTFLECSENGFIQIDVAIVELTSGRVVLVPPEVVIFRDKV